MARIGFFAIYAILFGIAAVESHLQKDTQDRRDIFVNGGSDEQGSQKTPLSRVPRYVPDPRQPVQGPSQMEIIRARQAQNENRAAQTARQRYMRVRQTEASRRQHEMRIERERQVRLNERSGEINRARGGSPINQRPYRH